MQNTNSLAHLFIMVERRIHSITKITSVLMCALNIHLCQHLSSQHISTHTHTSFLLIRLRSGRHVSNKRIKESELGNPRVLKMPCYCSKLQKMIESICQIIWRTERSQPHFDRIYRSSAFVTLPYSCGILRVRVYIFYGYIMNQEYGLNATVNIMLDGRARWRRRLRFIKFGILQKVLLARNTVQQPSI